MRNFVRAIALTASMAAACAAFGQAVGKSVPDPKVFGPTSGKTTPDSKATGQTAGIGNPDPAAILAAAKAASGGAAWDSLTAQHTLVALMTGGLSGEAERWTEISSGRSYLRFAVGPMSGTTGYDGTASWSQDPSGKTQVDSDEAAVELAANAAYRDQLAFWFPARHEATIAYKGRFPADGADFDVVAITPKGGREFDLWMNTETKLIERLVEHEAVATRTEIYMDWHDVQGVKIPFRVRVLRGDPKADELVVVERIEFDAAPAGINFARPE